MPGEEDKPQETTLDAATSSDGASREDENKQNNRAGSQNVEENAQQAANAEDEGSTADVQGVSETSETGDGQASLDNEDDVEQLTTRIQELEQENSSLKDQYLRKQAEFENFRKRMSKEKADAISFANQQLLQDLVQIIDDFERAIKSGEESRDFDAFHDGVSLIEKQFTSMLERKWGLTRFDSEGEEFDPQKHEAVTTEEVDDDGETRVIEEYQKGYFLHDRVLRSAKVKVSVPKSS